MSTATVKQQRQTFQNFEHYEADKDKLLDRLFLLAEREKWDYDSLSQRSGISVSTLYKWQSRRTRYPRLDTIWRMAKALGLRLNRQLFVK